MGLRKEGRLLENFVGYMYRVLAQFLYALTLSTYEIISLSESEEICNNMITKNPTTCQMCRYITL